MTSASIRFQTSRARVPGYSSLGLDREPAFIRTCARLRWRAHESITPGLNRTRTPPAIQSANHILPVVGKLRTAIERTNSLVALAVRPFTQWGHTGVLNFSRAFKAAGKPTFLPLVHDANQASGSFLKSFEVSKVLSSSRAAHVPNMKQKDARSHEQCTREYE